MFELTKPQNIYQYFTNYIDSNIVFPFKIFCYEKIDEKISLYKTLGYNKIIKVNSNSINFPNPYKTFVLYNDDLFIIAAGEKMYILGFYIGNYKMSLYFSRYYPDGKPEKTLKKRMSIRLPHLDIHDTAIKNGCQINTLASAMNIHYDIVLAEMKSLGWNNDKLKNIGDIDTLIPNTKISRWDYIFSKHCYYMSKIWVKDSYKITGTKLDDVNGTTVKSVAKYLNNGTYIIDISGHVLCLKDGQLYDGSDHSNGRVLTIYQIFKK